MGVVNISMALLQIKINPKTERINSAKCRFSVCLGRVNPTLGAIFKLNLEVLITRDPPVIYTNDTINKCKFKL